MHLPSQFLGGKKHGRGGYLEACGNTYEGPYVHDKMHGEHGTCTYANGNVYSGSFEQNKRHGAGRYVLASGDVYDGEWVDNKKHGAGTLTSASGEVYVWGVGSEQEARARHVNCARRRLAPRSVARRRARSRGRGGCPFLLEGASSSYT